MASKTTQQLIDAQEASLKALADRMEALKRAAALPLTPLQAILQALNDQADLEKERLAKLKDRGKAEEAAAKEAAKASQEAIEEVAARMKKAAARLKEAQDDVISKARGNAEALPVVGGLAGAVNKSRDATAQKQELKAAGGGGGSTEAMATFNEVAAVFGVVGAAASLVADTFGKIISASTKYVEAFAPSTVERMNQAMGDLDAVIGSALVPIISATADAFREIGAVLLPVMQGLRPVVQSLTDTISALFSKLMGMAQPLLDALKPLGEAISANVAALFGLLEPVLAFANIMGEIGGGLLKMLAEALKQFLDFLSPVITAMQMLGDVLSVAGAVVGAVMDMVVSTLAGSTGGIKDACDEIRNGFREVVKACVVAAAHLMKMMNMGAFVDALKKKMEGGERVDATGMKAATNSSFKSFADMGKQVSLAASIASGDGSEKETGDDFLKDIAGMIGQLSEDSLVNVIAKGVKMAVLEKTATYAKDTAQGVINANPIIKGFEFFRGIAGV